MVVVMGLEAFGAYIRTLRTKRGLTQGKLGSLIGVAGNTVYRIEAGRQEPETTQLASLLTTLGGRIKDVQRLLSGAATAADVEQLADEALTEQKILEMADTDPKRRAILVQIATLSDDPALIARIEDYLRGLDAGRSSRPDS